MRGSGITRPRGRVYPPIAEQLANIMQRLTANDVQIEHIINCALPSGAERLRVAELIARDLTSFTPRPYVDVPRITKELRLPAFEYSGERYVWPQRVDYSIIMTGSPRDRTLNAQVAEGRLLVSKLAAWQTTGGCIFVRY